MTIFSFAIPLFSSDLQSAFKKYLQGAKSLLGGRYDSTGDAYSDLYRLLPHYGTTLPPTRAIICHCQAQNDTSGAGKNKHSLFYSSLFTKSAETPINTGVARGEE